LRTVKYGVLRRDTIYAGEAAIPACGARQSTGCQSRVPALSRL
jgi:hypothetical protein